MRTVQANDPRSGSVQIADDLRSRIEAGEFAPGAKLPSIRELAGEYNVAQMTANGALQRLRTEGLVVASGRGHFVAEVPPDSEPTLADRLQAVEAEIRELRSRVARGESPTGDSQGEVSALRAEVLELTQRVDALETRLATPNGH
jgi:DNA-binding GntR family transcriptional regulator